MVNCSYCEGTGTVKLTKDFKLVCTICWTSSDKWTGYEIEDITDDSGTDSDSDSWYSTTVDELIENIQEDLSEYQIPEKSCLKIIREYPPTYKIYSQIVDLLEKDAKNQRLSD